MNGLDNVKEIVGGCILAVAFFGVIINQRNSPNEPRVLPLAENSATSRPESERVEDNPAAFKVLDTAELQTEIENPKTEVVDPTPNNNVTP